MAPFTIYLNSEVGTEAIWDGLHPSARPLTTPRVNACIIRIQFVFKENNTLNLLYKKIMPKDAAENI